MDERMTRDEFIALADSITAMTPHVKQTDSAKLKYWEPRVWWRLWRWLNEHMK